MTPVKQPDTQLTMMMVNGTQTVSVSERSDGLTWMEVVDTFLQFLRGCGYQVESRDIVEYLEDSYGPFQQPEHFDASTVTITPMSESNNMSSSATNWWRDDTSTTAGRDVF